MGYGFATHLWIHGRPEASQIKSWVLAADAQARADWLCVLRIDERTLVCALYLHDESRYQAAELVTSLTEHVRGFQWTLIDINPDHDQWEIETSSGDRVAHEEGEPLVPDQVRRAREILQSEVDEPYEEIYHYVDWGNQLDERDDLDELVLGLPEPEPQPQPSQMWKWFWPLAIVSVFSWFTVAAVQSPGPGAFAPRFTHFLIESWGFWLLLTFIGIPEIDASWLKRSGLGLAILVGAGMVVGLSPF